MDKIFKKSFFNDSSRRPGQQEKAGSTSLQATTGPRPSSNSKQTIANTKIQSRSTFPLEHDSPPNMKTPTPSIHNKATPVLPAGQQQKPSPQYQQAPPQTREHSPPTEHSNSTLGSNRNSVISLDNSFEDRQQQQQQRPPVPKHHSNVSQTSLTAPSTNGGGSITSTSGKPKEKAGKKYDVLASQVDTLNEAKTKLEQQLKGLRHEKDQQCMNLQRQCEELQRMLRFKEDEYTKMQNNFHKHVRAIRATDDDLSTIHAKLTMLQAKASQLPMALRGSYQEGQWKEVIIYFEKRWPALKGTLDRLLQHDATTGTLVTALSDTAKYESKLDYPLVCLLVEKMVMEILVEEVFGSPVHLGLSINNHYQALSLFMEQHHANDWSNKLRQQLCKLAFNANQEQVGITEAKARVVQSLKTQLDIVYKIPQEKLLPKLTKLVDLAAETSLAMHGQDEPVLFGTDLVEGDTMYNPRLMNLQFGSTMMTSKSTKETTQQPRDDQQENGDIKDKEDDDDDDDDDDEDEDDDEFIEASASPLPTPSLVLRMVVSPIVYAGDENGVPTPLLPARVICF